MMNASALRLPIGGLKNAFRRTPYLRTAQLAQRSMATAAAATSQPSSQPPRQFINPRQRQRAERLGKFHLWPQVPTIRDTHKDPMPSLLSQQIAKFDPTGARTRLFSKDHADSAKVGDILMVSTRTGEPFAGVFIQIRRRGLDTAIQLRGQLMKVGTEMWYKIYSPTTTGIDIIWRRPKRARRARLTYMRKPKHDMGSVDNYVFAWKKERYALRSKAKTTSGKNTKGRL